MVGLVTKFDTWIFLVIVLISLFLIGRGGMKCLAVMFRSLVEKSEGICLLIMIDGCRVSGEMIFLFVALLAYCKALDSLMEMASGIPHSHKVFIVDACFPSPSDFLSGYERMELMECKYDSGVCNRQMPYEICGMRMDLMSLMMI